MGVTTAPSAATAPWQNGPEKPGLRPDPAEEQRKYDEMMARQRTQAEQLNEVWEAKEAREEAAIVKVTLRIGVFF
ncbi:hypothetical protein ACFS4T_12710 [Pseudomonas lini]